MPHLVQIERKSMMIVSSEEIAKINSFLSRAPILYRVKCGSRSGAYYGNIWETTQIY